LGLKNLLFPSLPSLRIKEVQRPDDEDVADDPDGEEGDSKGFAGPEEGRKVGEAEEEEGGGDIEGEVLLGPVPGHEAHDHHEGREEEVREGNEFKGKSHDLSPRCSV
jgi:hypothetical protein